MLAAPDSRVTAKLLRHWLEPRLDARQRDWLDAALARVTLEGGAGERALFVAFSAAARITGKQDLAPSSAECTEAEALREGWDVSGWSRDQAVRVALLLTHAAGREADSALRTFDRLASGADLGELVCLYQALPVLPWPERHRARAAEGVRSNMKPVFEAVALRNPYPAEALDDTAWNQLVLKAVFLGSRLHVISGLDRRANASLAGMLVDFARERRAARRPVTPELWRVVAPFLDERAIAELSRALADPDPWQQRAAALALAAAPHPAAPEVLATRPDLAQEIRAERLDWERIASAT